MPALPRGQEVSNANISVVHVGTAINQSAGMWGTLEDKLAHDRAYVARAYSDIICNKSGKVREPYLNSFNLRILRTSKLKELRVTST